MIESFSPELQLLLPGHARRQTDDASAGELCGRLAGHLGEWCIDATVYRGLAMMPQTMIPRSPGRVGYRIMDNGVAVIELTGLLLKGETYWDDTTSLSAVRGLVRRASQDPNVKAILFFVDSPGGTVAGTDDLYQEIVNATAVKPTAAHVDDLGVNSAYWAIAGAGSIAVNRSGSVGGIGAHSIIVDSSRRAANSGLKVHVISSGLFKGVGTPGSTVEKDHLTDRQRVVDSLAAVFIDAVAKGRKLTGKRLATVTSGLKFIGEDAKAAGLVDRVQNLDATFHQLAEKIPAEPAA